MISFTVPVDEEAARGDLVAVRRVHRGAGVHRGRLEILGRKKNLRVLEGVADVACRDALD